MMMMVPKSADDMSAESSNFKRNDNARFAGDNSLASMTLSAHVGFMVISSIHLTTVGS